MAISNTGIGCPICSHPDHAGECAHVSTRYGHSTRCGCPGVIPSINRNSGGDEAPSAGDTDAATVEDIVIRETAPEPPATRWGTSITGVLLPSTFVDDTFIPGALSFLGTFGGNGQAVMIPLTAACYCENGTVRNPLWVEYDAAERAERERRDSAGETQDRNLNDFYTNWWRERGYRPFARHLPPEEEPCPECEGRREVLTRTGNTLLQFIRMFSS